MSVTAYKTPQTCATFLYFIDSIAWNNYNNAKASDNAQADCSLPKILYFSHYLHATNFGFAVGDIPSGATIDGIEAKIEHKGGAADSIADYYLYLSKTSGQVGSNKASASFWATSDVEITYPASGGATDKWGTTWVDTDITSSDFGLDLLVSNTNADNTVSAYVDCISIRVYYTVTFKPWAIIM